MTSAGASTRPTSRIKGMATHTQHSIYSRGILEEIPHKAYNVLLPVHQVQSQALYSSYRTPFERQDQRGDLEDSYSFILLYLVLYVVVYIHSAKAVGLSHYEVVQYFVTNFPSLELIIHRSTNTNNQGVCVCCVCVFWCITYRTVISKIDTNRHHACCLYNNHQASSL